MDKRHPISSAAVRLPRDVALLVLRQVGSPRDALSLCQVNSQWHRLCSESDLWEDLGRQFGFLVPVSGHEAFSRQVGRGRACAQCFMPYDEHADEGSCVHHPHESVIQLNPPPTFSAHEYWSCCSSSKIDSWLSDGCLKEIRHRWEFVARIHAELEKNDLRFEIGCLGEHACWDCEQQPCCCGSTERRYES